MTDHRVIRISARKKRGGSIRVLTKTHEPTVRNGFLQQCGLSIQCLDGEAMGSDLPADLTTHRQFLINDPDLSHKANSESAFKSATNCQDHLEELEKLHDPSMNFAEFVLSRFVPEYVATRRPAGRSHFHAILKHVLPPEQVARAFPGSGEAKIKLRSIPDWPYMDALRLCEIKPDNIQRLISTALRRGYSIQTATHLRNVIRAVFTHATSTGFFSGTNPADLVTLPSMARKEAHRLTLTELKQVMQVMRYPEKGIVLFALLTEINVAEVCGLQWKYVNVSNNHQKVDEETIPPRNIAIRNQSYRGKFGIVVECRRRFVPAPDLLCSILRDLKNRGRFTGAEDFVFASRSGTPIYPENIAARRLKSIGKALEMPWLSWFVFHRTRTNLRSQYGQHLHRELERVLPHDRSEARHPLGSLARRP